eukprot:s1490_g8.t4
MSRLSPWRMAGNDSANPGMMGEGVLANAEICMRATSACPMPPGGLPQRVVEESCLRLLRLHFSRPQTNRRKSLYRSRQCLRDPRAQVILFLENVASMDSQAPLDWEWGAHDDEDALRGWLSAAPRPGIGHERLANASLRIRAVFPQVLRRRLQQPYNSCPTLRFPAFGLERSIHFVGVIGSTVLQVWRQCRNGLSHCDLALPQGWGGGLMMMLILWLTPSRSGKIFFLILRSANDMLFDPSRRQYDPAFLACMTNLLRWPDRSQVRPRDAEHPDEWFASDIL